MTISTFVILAVALVLCAAVLVGNAWLEARDRARADARRMRNAVAARDARHRIERARALARERHDFDLWNKELTP